MGHFRKLLAFLIQSPGAFYETLQMTDAEKAIFWERSGGHPDLDQSGNQLSNSGLLLVEAVEIQRARCTWRWHRHALSKGSVIENVSIYSSLL